jgi:hypothetical protein
MIQTFEATVDESGRIELLEPIRLRSRRRALVTILDTELPDAADLAPEQTQAQMAAMHFKRKERLARSETGMADVTVPMIDDAADW